MQQPKCERCSGPHHSGDCVRAVNHRIDVIEAAQLQLNASIAEYTSKLDRMMALLRRLESSVPGLAQLQDMARRVDALEKRR